MKKILFACILFAISYNVIAQDKNQDKKVTRIARITVDSLQVAEYRKLLKEQMDAAVRLEPGVISYSVYADKTDPSKLTILEVYADSAAYLAHRETPHFKKYKSATSDMVKSLELSEVSLVLSAKKKDNY
jgi:quinol monooxygenase YgiN